MFVSQVRGLNGEIVVVFRDAEGLTRSVANATSVYALTIEAANQSSTLASVIELHGYGDVIDLEAAYVEGRLLPPITHPDPAHLHLTGTGLTHLGSAASRDEMHRKAAQDAGGPVTDSMKMFQMGLENGKPGEGEIGVQAEWFYKGNGYISVPPGSALVSPSFALDGGEEPELAGIYVIADDGRPWRIGYALSNEFSDHVTERINYLYLAHSKLRPASFGPEIRLGVAPEDIRGTSRIKRGNAVIYEKPFLTGEANMSHSFANLEYHHFKYKLNRLPGDIQIHMFGTATLSFTDGVRAEDGDVFEIEAEGFGLPLRNTMKVADEEPIVVGQL
ncbi:AraD1 family protein [Neorhizobium sp. JUb45]|uniref:AraD1 family protein n=1 Tax=Neorhizobium sp. JUb45 TaxID=2485113 RepID=UPI001049B527|nr:AraD1 family protein [Neorhizobium sp. JUb45]TCQ99053.1 hypothetical protein EDF70_11040 [Neorhizobium sp. JUb45]